MLGIKPKALCLLGKHWCIAPVSTLFSNFRKLGRAAGEMTQELRVYIALSENLSWVSNFHVSVVVQIVFTYEVLTTVALTVNLGCQFDWTWDRLKGTSLVESIRVFAGRADWGISGSSCASLHSLLVSASLLLLPAAGQLHPHAHSYTCIHII